MRHLCPDALVLLLADLGPRELLGLNGEGHAHWMDIATQHQHQHPTEEINVYSYIPPQIACVSSDGILAGVPS